MDSERKRKRGLIASYVEPHALGPRTRAALTGLGYRVVQASTMGRFDNVNWQPCLRLVDERHYDRIPTASEDPTTPLLLLTGQRPRFFDDDRIAGRVVRPASLTSLYPILQESLEETPRTAPRVHTQLSARVTRSDHRWFGSVTSLSENGCHILGAESLELGMRVNLRFALPCAGFVSTRAECIHVSDGGHGLVFCETPTKVRSSISGFVMQRLATIPAVA